MAKEVAAPRLEEKPACRLLLVTEAETEAAAEAGPPQWEEGLAGRAHEVAGNANTVPNTLSKAVCDHSESTHPAEILKSSLACGHKILQLGIQSTPRAPLRHESHAKNGGRRPSPLQNQNARRLTQKLRTEDTYKNQNLRNITYLAHLLRNIIQMQKPNEYNYY